MQLTLTKSQTKQVDEVWKARGSAGGAIFCAQPWRRFENEPRLLNFEIFTPGEAARICDVLAEILGARALPESRDERERERQRERERA